MALLDAPGTLLRPVEKPFDAAAHAALIADEFRLWRSRDMLAAIIGEEFPGRIALVSSFGAESSVLLHLVASIDRTTPIIFIDTGKLFPATHRYRLELVARLGLADMRVARPDPAVLATQDTDSGLWLRVPDRCCAIRKVAPLARAIAPFDAWISGRKRYQGGARTGIPLAEADAGRVKINPLAAWSEADIAAYRRLHDLPQHPLAADGYTSIGCVPCTDRAGPAEAPRAGRWRGRDKSECGIHLGLAAHQSDGSDGR